MEGRHLELCEGIIVGGHPLCKEAALLVLTRHLVLRGGPALVDRHPVIGGGLLRPVREGSLGPHPVREGGRGLHPVW